MMVMSARRSAPRTVLGVIAGAWAAAILVSLSGASDVLHHHQLLAGGPPVWAALLLFAVTWQVHIAAMMLPSSLPLVALFHQVSATQRAAGRARLGFGAGYAVVWTGFAVVALAGDVLLHAAVHSWGWLGERPWLVSGTALVVAGGYQFSSLKDACLRECRHPSGFLFRYYRHGARAGFEIGVRHGLFCVGCCASLMLVMVAAGIANLAWMAPLAALMYAEKATSWGERIVKPAGVALLATGALVLAHPAWLPELLGGV